jgi:hypothetical protein
MTSNQMNLVERQKWKKMGWGRYAPVTLGSLSKR